MFKSIHVATHGEFQESENNVCFGKRVSLATMHKESSEKYPWIEEELSVVTESTMSGAYTSIDASGSLSSVLSSAN